MDSVVIDVVFLLPPQIRARACVASREAGSRLTAAGDQSHFQLGQPYPAAPGGICEPHVSLFMLAANEADVAEIVRSVTTVAATLDPIAAAGTEVHHNPHGAPEVYYRRDVAWVRVQRSVIAAVEPLRRGRLRERDPSGEHLPSAVDRLLAEAPDDARLSQLVSYGYDEVTDDRAERFNPHVTLAWPVSGHHVDLSGLARAEDFSTVLTDLAVYGMSGQGTCTHEYARIPLTRQDPDGPEEGGLEGSVVG